MEIITIEADVFESLIKRVEHLTKQVETLCRRTSDKSLQQWLESQEACGLLSVSFRGLQALREKGTLPYSKVDGKIYYRPQDVKQLLYNLNK